MKILRWVALGGIVACGAARAEETKLAGTPEALAFEVESQLPCLFLGGYQLAVGVRRGRFRLRASVIDSGRFDVEPFGFDAHASRFERTFDDGSFGLYSDWFVTRRWYVGVLAASHRWRVESKAASATTHLRTFDTGFATGFQWFFYRGLFLEPVAHLFIRDRRTVTVGAERYRISGADWNAAFRLGARF